MRGREEFEMKGKKPGRKRAAGKGGEGKQVRGPDKEGNLREGT